MFILLFCSRQNTKEEGLKKDQILSMISSKLSSGENKILHLNIVIISCLDKQSSPTFHFEHQQGLNQNWTQYLKHIAEICHISPGKSPGFLLATTSLRNQEPGLISQKLFHHGKVGGSAENVPAIGYRKDCLEKKC